MPGRLSKKVCIVTGTGGSMGRATALTFAREGARVVGCDVTVEPAEETVELVAAAGGEMVSLHPCNLADPAGCRALIELAVTAFGRVDVLFNLAGMQYFNWLEDIPDEEWDRARRDEVDLVFYLTRAAWPQLKDSGGVVVNMASLNASLSFKILPSLAHTTNKAGIIGMTRQLAVEGREHGIRANSISPGPDRVGGYARAAHRPGVGELLQLERGNLMQPMDIDSVGIIGAGHIGQVMARIALRAGRQVVIANRRGPESLTSMVEDLGEGASAGTVKDAAAAGIVVLAVMWPQLPQAVEGLEWDGRIVIDPTNDFDPSDLNGSTSSEVVAELVAPARVVKAGNTLAAPVLASDPHEAGGQRVIFVSGDEVDAKAEVMKLFQDAGFFTVDLGSLSSGGGMQQFHGPLAGLNLLRLP